MPLKHIEEIHHRRKEKILRILMSRSPYKLLISLFITLLLHMTGFLTFTHLFSQQMCKCVLHVFSQIFAFHYLNNVSKTRPPPNTNLHQEFLLKHRADYGTY